MEENQSHMFGRLFGKITGKFFTFVENSPVLKLTKIFKKALAFFQKTSYTEISGNKSHKNHKQKGTLKKFENGQLGVSARIKFSEMRKQNRAHLPLTHLPIKLYRPIGRMHNKSLNGYNL